MPVVTPPTLREMRVKFKVQQEATTQDSYGHQTSAWTDFINPIWGKLENYVRPAFLTFVDHVQPTSLFDISMRYRPGVTKAMRVVEISTGRTFRIIDINNDNHLNQWLFLRCVEMN